MHRRPHLVPVAFSCATLLLSACGGGGGGGSTPPPPAPAPTFSIDTSGGQGGNNGGGGGPGGPVFSSQSTGNSTLSILKTGEADASFTPSTPTANLGDNPLTISTDTTIDVVTTEPAAGTPYFQNTDPAVYVSDGNAILGDEAPVTGLAIAQGVTLTLDLNTNTNTSATITLSRDLRNLGTITTVDTAGGARGGLILNVANYIAHSEIDTAGTTAAPYGGPVQINARFSIYNGGTIDSSGADILGGPGGGGGPVVLHAQQSVENSGTIDAHGGRSDVNTGGAGGSITLATGSSFPDGGSIYNSADLLSYGGEGTVGGPGADININAILGNGIRNGGRLDSHGGRGLNTNGGPGGTIYMYAASGPLISSGGFDSSGGDTQNAASNGGNGGGINLNVAFNTFSLPASQITLDQLDIRLSGDIDTSGGDATATGSGSGGSGGVLYINQNGPIVADGKTAPAVEFLGYASIDTSGGGGNQGGPGGSVEFRLNPGSSFTGPLPGGNIVNEASITTRGGSVDPASSGAGNGGSGGTVILRGITDATLPFDQDAETLTNSGDIDTRSGDSLNSTTTSISAGHVDLFNRGALTNSGAINAGGGNDAATDRNADGYGHDGNSIFLQSIDRVENSGKLTTRGGDGEYLGGNGQWIQLVGTVVNNSGALDAGGGDADPTLTGSQGGYGGNVDLTSPDDYMGVFNNQAANVSGGDGETQGSPGYDLEGSLCLSGTCPS